MAESLHPEDSRDQSLTRKETEEAGPPVRPHTFEGSTVTGRCAGLRLGLVRNSWSPSWIALLLSTQCAGSGAENIGRQRPWLRKKSSEHIAQEKDFGMANVVAIGTVVLPCDPMSCLEDQSLDIWRVNKNFRQFVSVQSVKRANMTSTTVPKA